MLILGQKARSIVLPGHRAYYDFSNNGLVDQSGNGFHGSGVLPLATVNGRKLLRLTSNAVDLGTSVIANSSFFAIWSLSYFPDPNGSLIIGRGQDGFGGWSVYYQASPISTYVAVVIGGVQKTAHQTTGGAPGWTFNAMLIQQHSAEPSHLSAILNSSVNRFGLSGNYSYLRSSTVGTQIQKSNGGLASPTSGLVAAIGIKFYPSTAAGSETDALADLQNIRRTVLAMVKSRSIYFPGSVPTTVPTLSASTYVSGSLTSTGWRPQITAS